MEDYSKVRVSKSNFKVLVDHYHLLYGECDVDDDVTPEYLVEDLSFANQRDKEIVLFYLHLLRKEMVEYDKINVEHYGDSDLFDLSDGSKDLKILYSFHEDAIYNAQMYLSEIAIDFLAHQIMDRSQDLSDDLSVILSNDIDDYVGKGLPKDIKCHIFDGAEDYVEQMQDNLKRSQA